MEDRYDSVLLSVLQNEGKIQPFLDVVFGFLLRRTDFYKILDESGKLGFSVGVAEKLTYNAFKKYQNVARKAEEEVSHQGDERTSADEDIVKKGNVDVDVPMAKVVPAEADSYNGAVRDTYSWSQSCNDVDVRVKIPKDVVKAKGVKVNMSHNRLSVSRWLNDTSNWETLLDGQLMFRINLEKSVWTLVPGEYVHVCLEKNDDRWWEALLVDEPKIDVRKIDAHRYLNEMPDDEQAKVEELMYDHQQKLLGKPTIAQTKIRDVLKEAWDKEGSPFRGQPYDPSVLNVCGSSDEFVHP